LIWYVNYRMLDIMGKEEILYNDVDILNSIQGERMLYELPSDEIIADKENMRSVIGACTSIHLVYVRISGKGINMF